VLLVSSHLSRKVWQACAQQTEKPLLHKLCSFTSSLCACLASSASEECIYQYMIWYGPKSEQVHMQKFQKNWIKYTDCEELKRKPLEFTQNCLIYCFLFFKSFKFVCCSFCFIKKKVTVNCTSVLPILFFASQ